MRKLFLSCLAVLPCLALLTGCPKKTEAIDAAAPAEVEASVEVAAEAGVAPPTAKNAGDVARFPSEKPLKDDDAKTMDLFTQAKTGPKSGNNVALIKAGSDVFKVAEFQDSVLVTFADPKDATVTLMGWIPKGAFTLDAVVDAGTKDAGPVDAAAATADAAAPADAGSKFALLKCAIGQDAVVNVVAGGGGACRKKCATDKDCKSATAGACATATTQVGRITKVCHAEVP